MNRGMSLVLALVMVIVLGAACVPPPAAQAPAVQAPAAPPAASAPAAAPAAKVYTIGYIQGGPELWQQSQADAAKYAAEKIGMKFIGLNSEYKPEKELSNAEDLVAKKVDAIVMFTVNGETGQKVAQMCNKANIPLFLIDGMAASGPGKVVTTVQFDFKVIGEMVGEYVSNKHPNSKLVYIQGLPGAGIVEAYTDGLTGKIQQMNKGVEVVTMQPADWDRAKAMNVMQNIIASGKAFDVAFVNNEDMARGAIKVLKDAGQADKVAVVSTGGSKDGLDMIKSGEIEATMAASPAYEAAVAIKAVRDYFDGKQVPEKIISPVIVVTKENVETGVSWDISDNILKLAGLIQ
jgi:ribose transport system substrate-binding protein